MITYLLDTLVNSIKTSLINKLGLDPSTEVDLDDFPQLIDDIPILDSVEELTVTENGTYTGTGSVTYNPVNVNLPLGSKSVTANGTYTASDDSLQGYSSVTVDIDDTDLYRDTTDSTYESVKTLSNCGAFHMLSLKVGIEPIQEGSGDPSPTNVRPISGWDEVNVTRRGKNLFDAQDIVTKSNHTTYTYIEDGYLHYNAGNATVNGINWYGLNFPCPLTFSGSVKNFASANENVNFYAAFDDGTQSLITIAQQLTPNEEKSFSVIIGVSGKKLVSLTNSWASARQLGLNLATTQLELGTTATEYEPYNGQTYTIQFTDGSNPLTVYGGSIDVVSGELKVVPYYASYNGETLEGEWISDRDVYAVGTTPTIGAQVVNIGATPTTYQLTPTQVKSLLGTNNIWADTGDVGDVRYFKKVEL